LRKYASFAFIMSRHNIDKAIRNGEQERIYSEVTVTRTLLKNAKVATMQADGPAYGLDGSDAIVLDGSIVAWVGVLADVPERFADVEAVDVGGRLVTPALIDCHTHLVFGGHRAMEFEMRLNGASYEEVARAGGGIVSTVSATREASEQELVEGALLRLDALIAEGVGTVEVKSGYGLDVETELRMLRAARALGAERDVTIKTSYLGAHAVPMEYSGHDDAFIEEVCIPGLRAAHAEGLVDAVDAFCEGIAFQPEQVARVFDVAVELGLPVKIHAEQLSNLGGAKIAAGYGALSADHIEYLDEEGVAAMAAASTVAVILPGAIYTLRDEQAPPIALLRKPGGPMAVATDANPGSSPMTSLLLAMNMASTLFCVTPEEALAGTTRVAAQALGLTDRGVIAANKRADLAVWDAETPAELVYRIGFNPVHKRIVGGVV
jgi:imidazolonepropionase